MALKIAFMGYNVRHTGMSMMQFAADNATQVERYERYIGRMLLTDGTEITAISNPGQLRGRRFDQAIIADDHRRAVSRLYLYLTDALHLALSGSNIPEEFRYQIYDIDEEAPNHGKA